MAYTTTRIAIPAGPRAGRAAPSADAVVCSGIVGRIYGNLGKLLGGKAAAGVISLGYLALASRSLGPGDYGVLVLIHGYAMTFGVLGVSGWNAVVRYGAQARAAGDEERLVRMLRYVGLVEVLGGMVMMTLAAALAPVVGPRLGWPPAAIAFALPYSLVVLFAMRTTPMGYLQLAGRFDLVALHHIVPPLVRLVGAVAVVATHAGLLGFLVVWLIAGISDGIAMWAFALALARRRTALRFAGPLRGVADENPGFWKFMVAANLDIKLAEIPGHIAPLAIGWVLGPVAAGLFSIGNRATKVLAQPANFLGQAAYAELAQLVAAGRHGAPLRRALFHCIGVALLAASPLLLVIALFAPRLAVLLGGAKFAGAATVMIWLALARTVAMLAPPMRAALTALGRPDLSLMANLIGGLGILAILPAMLHWDSLTGAGINLLLQAASVSGLLIWFVARETRAVAAR